MKPTGFILVFATIIASTVLANSCYLPHELIPDAHSQQWVKLDNFGNPSTEKVGRRIGVSSLRSKKPIFWIDLTLEEMFVRMLDEARTHYKEICIPDDAREILSIKIFTLIDQAVWSSFPSSEVTFKIKTTGILFKKSHYCLYLRGIKYKIPPALYLYARSQYDKARLLNKRLDFRLESKDWGSNMQTLVKISELDDEPSLAPQLEYPNRIPPIQELQSYTTDPRVEPAANSDPRQNPVDHPNTDRRADPEEAILSKRSIKHANS